MKRILWVLWPSFLVAIAMDGVMFSTFDPLQLWYDGDPMFDSRLEAYTIGFFVFWGFTTASSALTCYLQSTLRKGESTCPPNSIS